MSSLHRFQETYIGRARQNSKQILLRSYTEYSNISLLASMSSLSIEDKKFFVLGDNFLKRSSVRGAVKTLTISRVRLFYSEELSRQPKLYKYRRPTGFQIGQISEVVPVSNSHGRTWLTMRYPCVCLECDREKYKDLYTLV